MNENEFGSKFPLRFLNSENVSSYDQEGTEIIIPECEFCGDYKSQCISNTHVHWRCLSCCEKQP